MNTLKAIIAFTFIWVCSFTVGHAADVSCDSSIFSDTVLDSDLKHCPYNGIFIKADNITLDCNGHTISGSRLYNRGGILIDANGVTVKNCTVRDFDFGIMSSGDTNNHYIISNTAQYNLSFGFNFNAGDGITLKGNTSQWNDNHGFRLWGLTNSVIDDNTSMRNGIGIAEVHGFRISFSVGNTFNRNTSHQNGGHGFRISDDSNDNTFYQNTSQQNGGHGFRISGSHRNAFNENSSKTNGLQGIDLREGSTENTFAMNTIANNAQHGLIIRGGSDGNILTGNVSVNHKDGNGFHVLSSSGNSLTQNVAINNGNFDLADNSCPTPANVWEDNNFQTAQCEALQ